MELVVGGCSAVMGAVEGRGQRGVADRGGQRRALLLLQEGPCDFGSADGSDRVIILPAYRVMVTHGTASYWHAETS